MYVDVLHALLNLIWKQLNVFMNIILMTFGISKKLFNKILDLWGQMNNKLKGLLDDIQKLVNKKKKNQKIKSNVTGTILKLIVEDLPSVKIFFLFFYTFWIMKFTHIFFF